MPPLRRSICLACRTALVDGERCDGGADHEVVSLADRAGVDALGTELWGRSGLSVSFSLLGAFRRYRGRRHRRPLGARRRPAPLGPVSAVGTVEADRTFEPPLTMDNCVAFGLELVVTRWFRDHVMLRDAATCGFRLRLDDGRVAEIPAGRARLSMRGAGEPAAAYRGPAAHYLRRLAGDPRTSDGFPLFPFDHARLVIVRPGDRVTLHGPLAERPVPGADHTGGYRDAAPTVLAPTGVPAIGLVEIG